jgi:hypothetical protein
MRDAGAVLGCGAIFDGGLIGEDRDDGKIELERLGRARNHRYLSLDLLESAANILQPLYHLPYIGVIF